MTDNSTSQPSAQSKEKFRRDFQRFVERGYIQYVTEGNPFTLVASRSAAEQLNDYGLRLHMLDIPTAGQADGINMRFEHRIDWYDKDTKDKKDKGKNFGLMTYFDNNMDSLMRAIQGICVAAPSSQVSQPYRVGALAHDALAIS